jgi:ATP-dependent DNA helicase PIF1
MNLTDEQQHAFDLVKQGKSIFLTGPGGTGKSFLLKAMYDFLDKQVAVTAMTGCAAVLLGKHAKTLHSWAGIGLATETPAKLASKIRTYGKTFQRWLGTDVLIIDEVSMLTPELLEKLDAVAKLLRRDESPMGGLQIVFVGDFYQLPPVVKEGETSFVFESPLWNTIVQNTVCLTKIIRQSDPVFHKILDEARKGALSKESFQILQGKSKDKSWETFEIRPTLLYTRRHTVDRINEENLKALPGDPVIFRAKTVFQPTDSTARLTRQSPEVIRVVEQMDRDSSYMPELRLKKGAQVMLLSNLNHELGRVNGARGVVIGFDGSEDTQSPIVQFKTGTPIVIPKMPWMSSELKGVGREQIPLKLAYAVTVHKAQGATLDCALIDIGSSTFECGQAYVALSRVKNLESLYVWDVEPTAFRAHPKVSDFYRRLEQKV